MGPIASLFLFTLRQTLLSRKTLLTVSALAAPCALLLLIRCFAPPFGNAQALWEAYHVPSQFLLIMALVPLVCMVHGTAMIGAEVEARTITYLITRRMGRATVLLVKFAATSLALAVLCDLGMLGLHLCAFYGQDLEFLTAQAPGLAGWSPTSDLYLYLSVIPAAVVSFLAVFSFFGLASARPLATSILYLIVVELSLSNLPIQARVYSLLHQLRVTMAGVQPRITQLFELPQDLCDELYPEGATALPELFVIVAVALALACVLMTTRELTPTKASRE